MGNVVIKAPDLLYVLKMLPLTKREICRSYTSYKEGDLPTVVMEFLSKTETGEYSMRYAYPYGKMWYYEQILRIPIYVIFAPTDGMLEVRKLNSSGWYEMETLDEEGRYFIPEMDLYLGVWYGKRSQITIHWLRWWDSEGNMLLWGSEIIALKQQQLIKMERQWAEAAKLEGICKEKVKAVLPRRWVVERTFAEAG